MSDNCVMLKASLCNKIYVVLMNEDARPFMKAEVADGTFAWGHSPLHVKGYIYSNTSSAGLHHVLHGRVQMSLELRSETYAGDSCCTDYAYLKVGVPEFNALRLEASSCAPRRSSSSCRASAKCSTSAFQEH